MERELKKLDIRWTGVYIYTCTKKNAEEETAREKVEGRNG